MYNVIQLLEKVISLEELKEMANQHLEIELKMMKELPKQNFKDTMYFMSWYSNHPIRKELDDIMRNLTSIHKNSTI